MKRVSSTSNKGAERGKERPMQLFTLPQTKAASKSEGSDQPRVTLSDNNVYFNQTLIDQARAQGAKYVNYYTDEEQFQLGFQFTEGRPKEGAYQELADTGTEQKAKGAPASDLLRQYSWVKRAFSPKPAEQYSYEVWQRSDGLWAVDLSNAQGERNKAA
jgi:hypothetical protein